MGPYRDESTLIFCDAATACAAAEVLIRSGVRPACLSMHLWGHGSDVALRVRAPVGARRMGELKKLGALLPEEWSLPGGHGPSAVPPP